MRWFLFWLKWTALKNTRQSNLIAAKHLSPEVSTLPLVNLSAYDWHSSAFTPPSAWTCRSTGCTRCWPGLLFTRITFLMQPVIPEVNFPPVKYLTSGAPPEDKKKEAWNRGENACWSFADQRSGVRDQRRIWISQAQDSMNELLLPSLK